MKEKIKKLIFELTIDRDFYDVEIEKLECKRMVIDRFIFDKERYDYLRGECRVNKYVINQLNKILESEVENE